MAAFCRCADGHRFRVSRTFLLAVFAVGAPLLATATAAAAGRGGGAASSAAAAEECSTPPRADAGTHPFSLALLQRSSEQRPNSAVSLDDTDDTALSLVDTDDTAYTSDRDAAGTNLTLSVVASLDQRGYKQIANLNSDVQMRIFMRRLLGKLGLKVSDETEFRRVVPYYSGEKGVQTYAALIEEFEDPERSGHFLEPADDHPGASVALTEQGYQRVARTRSDEEMEKFMRRVIGSMSLKVASDAGLSGVVPWYSGTQRTQDFARMQEEIVKALKAPHSPRSWVTADSSLLGYE